ncbi:MAG: hypothetical protein KDK02_07330 [Rhodobacteraceae bacterium]|nr:hypothetical protein [Paracoccaceae bacterium]
MDQGQLQFNKRLRRLDRKHRAMQRGYATYMRPDGLIVAKPQGSRPRLPVKAVVMCLAGLILFKGYLIAQLGTAVYGERVGQLESGTLVEQAGAWVMQIDPASDWVAGHLRQILR